MKKYLLLFTFSVATLTSCDQKTLDAVLNSTGALSDADISKGLKQALEKGVDSSVAYLAKEGGYYQSVYKILLPAEAQMVTSKLRAIPGFGNLEEEAVKRINKAAEDAATKVGPIFLNAITQMTFADVKNILMGDKNAATQYLHRVTYTALYNEFKPVVVGSLNKFGALDYWGNAVNSYNKIPFVDKVNPDLADHVTNKALDGLFALIEQKELGIRTDLTQRTSDILKKVFARQD